MKTNRYSKLEEVANLAENHNLDVDGFNLVDIFISQFYLASLSEGKRHARSRTGFRVRLYRIKLWLDVLLYKSRLKPASVVLFPTERNHLDQLIPIAEALECRSIRIQFITTRKRLHVKLRRLGFNSFLFASYGKESISTDFIYESLKSNCLVVPPRGWVREIRRLTRVFENVKEACRPEVVVVGYDITHEGRLASRYFRSRHTYTCCVQHGEMSGILNSRHIVDEFFVFGQITKEQLEKLNPKRDTLFTITGAPYLDPVLLGRSESVKKVPRMLGMGENSPYLLVAFSGPGNNTSFSHHKKLIECIFEIDKWIKTAVLVVKLHPKDRVEYYEELYDRYPEHNIVIGNTVSSAEEWSIFDWLSGCDILITGASTTAIEAMIKNVPVVSIDLEGEYREIDFIKTGATICVDNLGSLQTQMTRLLNDKVYSDQILERQRLYANKYFLLKDGSSAERCVNEIVNHLD